MDEIGIDKARPRLGDIVSDAQNGATVVLTRSGKPAAMLVPLNRLTDADRALIARARALAAIPPGAPVDDTLRQLGRAKDLLRELAAAYERLGGPVPDEEENHG